MENKIIVYDFDKTLTNYDTTLPFFLYCSKKKPFIIIKLPFYFCIKVMSKFRFITVKREKEIGLKLFCSKKYSDFKNDAITFSKKIVLNDLYREDFQNNEFEKNKIIVASAAFKDIIDSLFLNTINFGTTLKVDDKGYIIGIENHPFKREKLEILKGNGIDKIDVFYTDSKNDIYVSWISKEILWIKNGEVIK